MSVPTNELELAFAGPAALGEMVREGQVHPRVLMELYLKRIEALDPQVMIQVTGKPELKDVADEATSRLRAALDSLAG